MKIPVTMVYTGENWYDWVYFPSLSKGAICLCSFFKDKDLILARASRNLAVTCNVEVAGVA